MCCANSTIIFKPILIHQKKKKKKEEEYINKQAHTQNHMSLREQNKNHIVRSNKKKRQVN